MSQSIQPQPHEFDSQFVNIPATELMVSRIALGTWAMGGWMWGGTDERDSIATIRAALDQGVNLIDTAPVYGFGVSEEIVGEAVRGDRSAAIVATKVGIEWRDGKVHRNATRERIMTEVHESLRRLRTDYIDIYQVHWPDPLVPMEETPARCEICTNRERFAPLASAISRWRRSRPFVRWRPCTCYSRRTTCSNGLSRTEFFPTAWITKLRPWAMARCAADC